MSTVSYSPTWGGSYSPVNNNQPMRKLVAQRLNVVGFMKDRELLRTLLGAAAGSTATKTRSRVAHSTTELGGKRTIETQTLVNRATTSGDVTDLKAALLAYDSKPAATTYPRDARLNH